MTYETTAFDVPSATAEELHNHVTRCPFSGKNLAARQRLRAAFISRLSARTSIARDRIGKHRKHRKQTELSPRRLMQMQPHERAAVINRHAIKLIDAEIRKGLHA